MQCVSVSYKIGLKKTAGLSSPTESFFPGCGTSYESGKAICEKNDVSTKKIVHFPGFLRVFQFVSGVCTPSSFLHDSQLYLVCADA